MISLQSERFTGQWKCHGSFSNSWPAERLEFKFSEDENQTRYLANFLPFSVKGEYAKTFLNNELDVWKHAIVYLDLSLVRDSCKAHICSRFNYLGI